MERSMRDIVNDILTWPWFSEPHGYNFNGHLVHDPGGNICIDPVEPMEDDRDALIREGGHPRRRRGSRPKPGGGTVGPLEVVDASGKAPGAVALLWRDRGILSVGDAIIGNPPGQCGLLPERVMDDPARLRSYLCKLLDLDVDILLVGDGETMLQNAKARLNELVETFPD